MAPSLSCAGPNQVSHRTALTGVAAIITVIRASTGAWPTRVRDRHHDAPTPAPSARRRERTMSDEDLKAELERLRNENVALKKRAASDRRVLSEQRPCVSCASPPSVLYFLGLPTNHG